MNQSKFEIFKKLDQITDRLSDLYISVGDIASDELRIKAAYFIQNANESITSRVEGCKYVAQIQSTEILRLRGQINALTEERDYIRLLLQHYDSLDTGK